MPEADAAKWEAFAEKSCSDGLHAHPTRCDTFYQCNAGHRYPDQKCPAGLVYNADKEYCDWPSNAQCKLPKWSCYATCHEDKWWSVIDSMRCSKKCFW